MSNENKAAHISGWYALAAAIIASILSAYLGYRFSPSTIELTKLVKENDQLVQENKTLTKTNTSLQTKVDNSKSAELKSGNLIVDGLENGERNNVIAVVDNKTFYLESLINDLSENKIAFSGNNIIFGANPEQKDITAISFDKFDPGYNVLYDGEYYSEFQNGEEVEGEDYGFGKFSMAGKEYLDGFSIRYKGYVLLKLDRQFSGIKLDIGRIDGTNSENTQVVIKPDSAEESTLDLNFDSGIKTFPAEGVINVNYSDIVKVSLRGQNGRTAYGFTNITLYK